LRRPYVKLREASGAVPRSSTRNARGQRIERAEVANLAEADDASHGFDDIVRRSASRLVDDQGAVQASQVAVFRGMGLGRTGSCPE